MARNYSKSYHGSSFGFSSKRGKKRLVVNILYTVIILTLVSGIGYFFIFSKFFKIKNISVSGNDYIVGAAIIGGLKDVLNQEKFIVLKNDNINFFDIDDAKTDLMLAFPRIEEISLEKKYPSSIKISIKEKEISEILCKGDKNSDSQKEEYDSKCYFIDKNGVAFDEAAQTQGFLILKIIDKRGQDFGLNSKALNKEFVDFVGVIRKKFKSALSQNIKWFVLEHPAQREVVAVVDNWRIIFDIEGSPEKQLFVLKEVIDKEIKDQKNNLEYVDLRIDGRAYYKLAN